MKTFALTAGVVGFLAVAGCATTAAAQSYDPGYGDDGNYDNNEYNSPDNYNPDDSAYSEDPGSAPSTVSEDTFYESLSPYGEWVTVNGYGSVWRPYPAVVGVNFRPYVTGGHWVYTDYGWSFESDYNWGWAPFHYGRWFYEPVYGWVWRPGRVWAPAWVDWRYGNGYVGWAPLPPPGWRITVSNYPGWCFVETRYMVHPHFYNYIVPPSRVTVVYNSTSAFHHEVSYGHARWYSGPPATHVATAVGTPIRPVNLRPPTPGYIRPVHISTAGSVSYGRPPAGQGGGFHAGTPPPGTRPPSGFGTGTPPPPAGHPSTGFGSSSQGIGGRPPPPPSGAWGNPNHNPGIVPPAHHDSPPPSSSWGGRPVPPVQAPPSSGWSGRPMPPQQPPPPSGGFHGGPPAGGGFHTAAPPSGGGGGGFHAPPAAPHGGGGAPPASHGGGHAATPRHP